MRERTGRLALRAHTRRTRRLAVRALAPVLLAGLWVMHGMAATTASGCHGGTMPLPVPAASAPRPQTAAEQQAVHGAMLALSRGETAARPTTHGPVESGDLCLSGAPPTGGALLSLLLAAIAWWLPDEAEKPTSSRSPLGALASRAPPGSWGSDLLVKVCVART